MAMSFKKGEVNMNELDKLFESMEDWDDDIKNELLDKLDWDLHTHGKIHEYYKMHGDIRDMGDQALAIMGLAKGLVSDLDLNADGFKNADKNIKRYQKFAMMLMPLMANLSTMMNDFEARWKGNFEEGKREKN